MEELPRVYCPASLERSAKADLEFHGVTLRKFDRFVIIPALFNTDPQTFDDPLRVDFERRPQRHMAFGAGPHHCVGANPARSELRISLEEWGRAIPEFALPQGAMLQGIGGFVMQLTALPLEWDVAITHAPVMED